MTKVLELFIWKGKSLQYNKLTYNPIIKSYWEHKMITFAFYWSDNPGQITTSYWKHRARWGHRRWPDCAKLIYPSCFTQMKTYNIKEHFVFALFFFSNGIEHSCFLSSCLNGDNVSMLGTYWVNTGSKEYCIALLIFSGLWLL